MTSFVSQNEILCFDGACANDGRFDPVGGLCSHQAKRNTREQEQDIRELPPAVPCFAPLRNGAFRFEDQSKNLAGAHEVGEVLEEGACLVHGVEALGFAFRQAHRFESDDAEPRLVNAREDFPLKAARNGVRFDQCQSSFESQADSSISIGQLKNPPCTECGYMAADLPRAAATVDPISAGVSTVRMPAARRAAYLSFAVPCPPLMIAPA